MSMRRIGTTWLVRVGIATAILAGVGMMAEPGKEIAAGAMASADIGMATHAILLFAVVWFIASLRIRREEDGWRFGFDPSPVPRIPGDTPSVTCKASADGRADRAGASGNS